MVYVGMPACIIDQSQLLDALRSKRYGSWGGGSVHFMSECYWRIRLSVYPPILVGSVYLLRSELVYLL